MPSFKKGMGSIPIIRISIRRDVQNGNEVRCKRIGLHPMQVQVLLSPYFFDHERI